MEKFKSKYRLFLYHILCFSLTFLCFATYEHYKNTVPDKIFVKAGTREEIDWNIPASGVVVADSTKVVSFSRPVTIVAGTQAQTYALDLKLFGVVPLKQVDVEIVEQTQVIPLGSPIGIYVKTQGVLVLDTGSFTNEQGEKCAPAENVLKKGDYLLAMDGVAIEGKKQVREYVESGYGKTISFQIKRESEIRQVEVTPEACQGAMYKMGAWLRDSAQGIGIITYMDENMQFGALGHGINDVDVGELLTLGNGLLYRTEILSITKGTRGKPGEITGLILYEPNQICGIITKNTPIGIYGSVSEEIYEARKQDKMPIAFKQEVKTGHAQILCQMGTEKKYYDIDVTSLDYNNKQVNQRIAFKVVDEELLDKTGGIVQGMSGSPIIQDGKLIGAVTHVFVNDPTKGYGIFIENMLEQE